MVGNGISSISSIFLHGTFFRRVHRSQSPKSNEDQRLQTSMTLGGSNRQPSMVEPASFKHFLVLAKNMFNILPAKIPNEQRTSFEFLYENSCPSFKQLLFATQGLLGKIMSQWAKAHEVDWTSLKYWDQATVASRTTRDDEDDESSGKWFKHKIFRKGGLYTGNF